jgi:hypothetical protein
LFSAIEVAMLFSIAAFDSPKVRTADIDFGWLIHFPYPLIMRSQYRHCPEMWLCLPVGENGHGFGDGYPPFAPFRRSFCSLRILFRSADFWRRFSL